AAATVAIIERGRPALVMNALVPSITHWSPSWTARVRTAPASDPPPGSVSPNAASPSPAASGGSQRRFRSSGPYRQIGIAPRPPPASTGVLPAERQAEQAHPGDLVEDGGVGLLGPVHRLGPGRGHGLRELVDDLAEF